MMTLIEFIRKTIKAGDFKTIGTKDGVVYTYYASTPSGNILIVEFIDSVRAGRGIKRIHYRYQNIDRKYIEPFEIELIELHREACKKRDINPLEEAVY